MSNKSKSCSGPFNAEPTATRPTIPMWLVVLTLVLLFPGAVYFDHHRGSVTWLTTSKTRLNQREAPQCRPATILTCNGINFNL
jgi:hypothetical protein